MQAVHPGTLLDLAPGLWTKPDLGSSVTGGFGAAWSQGSDDGGHQAKGLGRAPVRQGSGLKLLGKHLRLASDGLRGLSEGLLS